MATQEEAIQKLDTALASLGQIGKETAALLVLVDELKQAGAANAVPQAVMDKINAVADQAKIVDDKVPDAAPEPAPTPTEETPTTG